MNSLWLLTESDSEDFIFEALVEKITNAPFQPVVRRLKRTRGISGVRKNLPLFVNSIRRAGKMENSYFVIAVDNDRQVERRNFIEQRLTELLGPPETWPIQGAIAVPVEMIEAWALLARGNHGPDDDLPKLSLASSPSARKKFGPNPPPQLKDLVDAERKASDIGTQNDYMLNVLLNCELEDLCQRSNSFREFYNEILEWTV